MKNIKHLIITAVVGISVSAFAAGSFEEYMKQQMNDYQSYLEEIDREFTSFLKQNWKEYEGKKPEKLLDKPKPVDIPVAKPDAKPEPVKLKPAPEKKPEPVVDSKPVVKEEPKPVTKPEPVVTEEPKPVVIPPVVKPEPKTPVAPEPVVKEPVPAPPVVAEPEPKAPVYVPSREAEGLALSFYGVELDVPYDKKLKTFAKQPLSSTSIADWWEAVASVDYKKTLEFMQKTSKNMSLGDWGYVTLVERFAAKLYGHTPERKMLVWFFLNKAELDAKLGYTKDGETKVMARLDKQLYGVPFYTFGGVRYYVIDVFGKQETAGSMYTYKGKYPDATNPIKLTHMDYPNLGFAGYKRDLKFDINGQKYSIAAVANRYSIAYLNNFPQADLSVYTGAKTPEWIDKTILPELKKLVKGKNEKDAVNILLRFAQTAFEYKTDDQQFGREKFFFAEETIYYPFSDCEDRSVLFAYLVRKLLGLDVVMLDFPGHIAVAVNLGKYNTGAVLQYKGKTYSVTDPTYINATAGMVMPQFKNSSPSIIEPEI